MVWSNCNIQQWSCEIHPRVLTMNINVLSLSVLAGKKGHGPQFHKGTRGLLFIYTFIIDFTCGLMCILHILEISRDCFDFRNPQMSVMWCDLVCFCVCVCFSMPSHGAGTWSICSLRVMTALNSLFRATSAGSWQQATGRTTACPRRRGRSSTELSGKEKLLLASNPFFFLKDLYIFHLHISSKKLPSDLSFFLCT